jgi:hypothetical protein
MPFERKAFNQVLLEEGVVPLPGLRRHVIAWLDLQVARKLNALE